MSSLGVSASDVVRTDIADVSARDFGAVLGDCPGDGTDGRSPTRRGAAGRILRSHGWPTSAPGEGETASMSETSAQMSSWGLRSVDPAPRVNGLRCSPVAMRRRCGVRKSFGRSSLRTPAIGSLRGSTPCGCKGPEGRGGSAGANNAVGEAKPWLRLVRACAIVARR